MPRAASARAGALDRGPSASFRRSMPARLPIKTVSTRGQPRGRTPRCRHKRTTSRRRQIAHTTLPATMARPPDELARRFTLVLPLPLLLLLLLLLLSGDA